MLQCVAPFAMRIRREWGRQRHVAPRDKIAPVQGLAAFGTCPFRFRLTVSVNARECIVAVGETALRMSGSRVTQ
ncbi:hypothetical protein P3T21_001315 [Paraburkholderia sp. GAS334]